jgi:muramoyltetrapeptide carboxypeptidase
VIRPRALRPGDRVAIVSPASPFAREELDAGAAELRALGYQPVYDDTIFEQHHFSSGTAAVRADAFRRAWSDPEIAAIVAVRGGYGSVQMLPVLADWEPQRSPKIFVGYSDTTSILSWLTCQCGLTAIHGPMLERRLSRGDAGYDRRSFTELVQGRGAGLELMPASLKITKAGEAAGLLFGGTITQLAGSLGTPFAFAPPVGSVLFLEDVNERPYRVDRMLTQLRQGGVFQKAKAIVFGEMEGCRQDGGPTMDDVIRSVADDFSGPVLTGFPSGHTKGPTWTLPLGVRVRVRASSTPAVIVEESPVE